MLSHPLLKIPLPTLTYDPRQSDHVQMFVPGLDERFQLPSTVSKGRAVTTVVDALRQMGATETEMAYFRLIADWTDRIAWHSRDRSLICWRRQCDLARALGMTERTARRIEKRLAAFGVIARTTAANGYRGRRSGQGSEDTPRAGLSLEPTLANYGAFAALNEMAAQDEAARRDLALQVQMSEQRVKLLVAHIRDDRSRFTAEATFAELRQAHRPTSLRTAEADALTRWQTRLLEVEDAVRCTLQTAGPPARSCADHIPESRPGSDNTPIQTPDRPRAPTPDPVENMGKTGENGTGKRAAPDKNVRCGGHPCPVPLQPRIDRTLYGCRTGPTAVEITHRTSKDPSERPIPVQELFQDPESGPKDVRQSQELPYEPAQDGVNTDIWNRLQAGGWRELVSEEALLYLEACSDYRDAITLLLKDLKIHVSAFSEARRVLGEPVAVLALLVIDRNRYHPTAPVRNPGGALRAFVRAARQGNLNLTRSILGILERSRAGRQEKGSRSPMPV